MPSSGVSSPASSENWSSSILVVETLTAAVAQRAVTFAACVGVRGSVCVREVAPRVLPASFVLRMELAKDLPRSFSLNPSMLTTASFSSR